MNTEGEQGGSGPAPPTKRARYEHPLAHYASALNRSVRTLKGLIAIGRDATPPELPPFDDLPRMKDWWTRHMKNRVPDDVAALAAVRPPPVPQTPPAEANVGPLFAAAASAPSAPSSSAPPPPAAAPARASVGFSAALQRLRTAEAAAGELYTKLLLQAGDDQCPAEERLRFAAEAEQARRAWVDLGEKLRRNEKDAENILAASGRMWSADDVLAANDLVHLVLRESFVDLLRRVRPKLANLPPAKQDELWAAEIDGMFAALRDNKFTAPSLAAPAPTPPTPPAPPPADVSPAANAAA
jgi:hypothetical protein